MKTIFVIMAAFAPFVLSYDEKYDKMDVDKIMADEALFKSYLDCMLDKGPCDQENAADFRKLLPEVVETACGKCSGIQRQHIRKFVKTITEKKPEYFDEFLKKYDPDRKYETGFAAFLLRSD